MTIDEFATPERILISDFIENHILTIQDENEFVALICSILWRRAVDIRYDVNEYREFFNNKFKYILRMDERRS